MNKLKCSTGSLVDWHNASTCACCSSPLSAFKRSVTNKRKLFTLALIILALAAPIFWTGCSYLSSNSSSVDYQRSKGAASMDNPVSLLPAHGTLADVMTLSGSERFMALSNKLVEGMRRNSDWFKEYVKQATPGQPLPYHPNMGVTPGEYDEYLQLTGTMTLKKVGETRLSIKQESPQTFIVNGDSSVPALKEIKIDFAKQIVETPLGICTKQDRIVASPKQKATGPWNGLQWETLSVNEESLEGSRAQFSLGEFQSDDKGILLYRGSQVVNGKLAQNFDIILVYSLNER